MKRLIKKADFDYTEIQQGDYVDFGPYGKRYVCNPHYSDTYFWVTDNESERSNSRAMGWSMPKYQAERIIESYDEQDW